MNGLTIQWGIAPGYNGAQTILFQPAFISKPSVTAILYGNAASTAVITELETSFVKIDFAYNVSADDKGGPWMAVGYS